MPSETPVQAYLTIAWRRKWFLIVPSILGLATSAVLLKNLPRIYEATAKVTEERGEGVQLDGGRRGNSEAARMALVRLQLPDFAEPVARKVYDLRPSAIVPEEKIAKVKNALNLELYGDLIYFKARGMDPEFITKVSNFYAEEFVDWTFKKKKSRTGQYANFYDKELQEKKAALEAKDREIATFKDAHRGALPEDNAFHNQSLERLHDELAQARSDLQSRLDEQTSFVSALSMASASPEGDGTVVVVANGLETKLHQLETELETLRLRLTEKHPDVQAKLREIDALEEQIAAQPPEPRKKSEPVRTENEAPLSARKIGIINYERLMSMDREIARVRGRITNLENEIAKHQGAIGLANRSAAGWEALSRERAQLAEQYNTLSSAAEKASLDQDKTTLYADTFRLQQPAQIPETPVSPVPKMVLGLGLGLGMGLGVGLAMLAEILDQTYKSPEEVTKELGIPVVATITHIDLNRMVSKRDRPKREAV